MSTITAITEQINTIKDSTTAIKQAIIEKGGTIKGDLTTYASAIVNLPSGSGDINPTADKNDVTFYDYDGTIRYSYTSEEFLALTEMPPLPTQKGLICQEWNYDITNAKAYVEEYGVLDIGATYITDDGKTRLYIRITTEGRMDVPLYFQQTVTNGVTIDWGDGSATETLDGTGKVNTTHRYASIGDYMISLDVADGCTLILGHSSSDYCVLGSTGINGRIYCNMLQKVEIGRGVTSIGICAFYYCHLLSSVVIPSGVSINNYTFYYCYSLSSVIIPSGVSIGSHMFCNCYSLSSVVIPSSATSIGIYAFQGCYYLSSAVIPSGVTSIGIYAFSGCYSLSSVVIHSGVTTIGAAAFNNCTSVVFYDFSTHTSIPTLANTNAFTSIPSDCKIIVPDNLYDEWIAATNWSTYSSNIIKKSEWDARHRM